jgi:hypothetical protein
MGQGSRCGDACLDRNARAALPGGTAQLGPAGMCARFVFRVKTSATLRTYPNPSCCGASQGFAVAQIFMKRKQFADLAAARIHQMIKPA